MRIYRLTYEEIDTDDKFNPARNTRITAQQAISEYELTMLYPNDRFAIEDAKQKILREIASNM